MSERLTRQQIYDRIRETSRDEFILSEMKKLGFWKPTEGQPSLSEDLIKREGELHRELSELFNKQRRFENQQAMLAEMRKKRLAESKQKQKETKERNEQKRLAKAEKWKNEKQKTINYLGESVSGGLNQVESDVNKLNQFGLPHFENIEALVSSMKLSVGKLRFLCFNRKVSAVSHYKRFYIPKKTTGKRLISAPMPLLKDAQYWILSNILYKIKPTEQAHGFVPTRSIISNAKPHIHKDVVVNLDLKDFFPSIDYKRVKGLFLKFGYSQQFATIFSLICTEPDVEMVEIDRNTYFTAKSERKLPQGAPTSPAITNLICYRLDHRFEGIAKKFGFIYTRYADDLTFSAEEEGSKLVGQLLWSVKQVIENEGFQLHPDKLKIMRRGFKQEVTGIVVNEKLSIDREELRQFRALIHQINQSGVTGKFWGKGKDLENSMRGYANFVKMVKPEQGRKFQTEIDKIFGAKIKSTNPKVVIQPTESKNETPQTEPTKPSQDGKSWWEVI